jgi:hypothetical protein
MKLNRYLAVIAAVLLIGVPAVFAQTTASLTGTVTLGGNPLPGATVTISSPNLQGTRTAVTDANGNYNFGALPPGDYTAKVDMESMQSVTKQVRVGLAQTARADADMKLSAVAEAITVTASAPAVLETTELQTNITARLVEDLPLARDLRGTVSLAPGVTNNGPGGNQVISGAPSYDNLYLIDGAVVNENLRGQPHDLYIEDAIQETTVLTGAISAEYGRFSGGVVTAVSKSGGNEFSGSLRDSLDKPSWSAKSGTLVRKGDLNQTYEGTLGGRIIRDRLWFFTAGRYFKQNNPGSLFSSTALVNAGSPPPTVIGGRKQQRGELKLTGQVTPKHSVTVAGLNITDEQTNNPFPSFGATLEPSAIDPGRKLPNSFLSAHYNGVITNSWLIEGNAAKKKFAFVGSGGDASATDYAHGTNIEDFSLSRTGVFAGAPTFCGSCSAEHRDNKNWSVKSTYYASTKSLGTHNLVAGFDDWHQRRLSDNHQSATDFTVITYAGGGRDAAGNATWTMDPVADLGKGAIDAIIIWWPILESSKGNDLGTQSLYVNDKWDFTNKLSFNVGARYDKNKGLDSAHQVIAKDSKISPRLGMIYDVLGNGRVRLNASYSQYVSAIADGNVADAASPAGQPSYLYWLYYGGASNKDSSVQFLQKMFDWFKSVGFTSNKDFLLGGKSNGISSTIPNALKSPYVGEATIGMGAQIGNRGFVRGDFIHRKWKNFYTTQTQLSNGKVFDPLLGTSVELTYNTVTNDFKREYNAVQVQASYAPFTRLNLGGNYTYARLRGNHAAETSGSGPVGGSGANDYPEYLAYANRNPIGWLSADQRHKVRAWASFDQPTPFGTVNFSLLQNYDSGTPYSALGTINPQSRFCNAGEVTLGQCTAANIGKNFSLKNPGYTFPPNAANYYFSQRGAFRTDNITSTNLAVNWNFPPLAGKVQAYLETELRNAFNRKGATNVNTAVNTARNAGYLRAFNPFTETPIGCASAATSATADIAAAQAACRAAGANYQLGSVAGTFGKPSAGTALRSAGDFQLPRTYLISVGARF